MLPRGVGQSPLGQISLSKAHSDSYAAKGSRPKFTRSKVTRPQFSVEGHSAKVTSSSFGPGGFGGPFSVGQADSAKVTSSLVLGHVYSAKVTSSSFGPGGFDGPFSVGQADSAKVTRPKRSRERPFGFGYTTRTRPLHSDASYSSLSPS